MIGSSGHPRELELQSAFDNMIRASKRSVIVVEGIISDVNETEYTCSVTIGESIFYSVPLRVLINDKASIIEIPADQSDCLMTFRDGDIQRPQIFLIQKCAKLLMDVSEINIISDSLTLNEGLNGGLVFASNSAQRLNNIENDINNLKTIFTSWIPTSGDGGAALKTAATAWAGNQLTLTKQSDIENTKIKQ